MIPVLLIVVPILTGFITFFIKEERSAKAFALLSSVATLAIALIGVLMQNSKQLSYDAPWLEMLGSRFTLSLDGMGKMLTLLTAISFPIIFASTYNNKYKNPNAFYGFMLLSQAGLLGVFLCIRSVIVLLLLGTCSYSCLFPLFKMGRGEKDTCYFQIFYLHVCRFVINAGRYSLR
jgi:NADH-quinone oxidoreductase subunit M